MVIEVYKHHVVEIKEQQHENKIEFNIRKWFILKNIDSVVKKKLTLNELHNLANVFVKRYRYNCHFESSVENRVDELARCVYLQDC